MLPHTAIAFEGGNLNLCPYNNSVYSGIFGKKVLLLTECAHTEAIDSFLNAEHLGEAE